VNRLTSQDGERVDPEEVGRWFHQYGGPLRSFLLGVTGDLEAAEEAVQATFAKAMEAGHTARADSLKGWLFRVAYNEAMLAGRTRQRRDRSLKRLAEALPSGPATPEELASLDESIRGIRELIAELPEDQRAVVRKRIYEDKTFRVIAEEMGAPLGTVLTRMRSALAKLHKRLSDTD
jgi:RNA polymerase sigma-70 factor (ECF subfamily)